MKLIYYIIIRISLVLSVLLTGWAILFYFAVMDEVNDEVDDSLEDYSEIIIIRALAGEELPSKNTASNNQYFLREVTKEYAGSCDIKILWFIFLKKMKLNLHESLRPFLRMMAKSFLN